jgi:hypothetical protein
MAVETYLHWHQKLFSPEQSVVNWLRLSQFQSQFCIKLRRGGQVRSRRQLPQNIRHLEIRPEAGAKILERAANLSGKVFHKFCRLQQTFR